MTPEQLLKLDLALRNSNLDEERCQYHPKIRNEEMILKLLKKLAYDERELVIDFISDYKVIIDYRSFLYDLLETLDSLHQERILLVPLMRYENNYNCSGVGVLYEIKSLVTNFGDKFKIGDSPWTGIGLTSGLPKYVVDDFIGTGEQFWGMYGAIKEKEKSFNIDGVASVAIMRQGKEALENKGVRVVSANVCEKAISYYAPTKGRRCSDAYSSYDKIEHQLKIDDIDHRGRRESEGLVSLKRTPNNTLPIFWHKGGDGKWPAPFPRNS